MNTGVVIIIVVAAGLIALVVMPRVRGFGRAEKTTVESRTGKNRRQRNVRVPLERRKRNRRAQDAAKAFVEKLSG